MCGFVIPWAVFPPVRGRDLLPGVIKMTDVLEDPHGRVLFVLAAVVDCVNARRPINKAVPSVFTNSTS